MPILIYDLKSKIFHAKSQIKSRITSHLFYIINLPVNDTRIDQALNFVHNIMKFLKSAKV